VLLSFLEGQPWDDGDARDAAMSLAGDYLAEYGDRPDSRPFWEALLRISDEGGNALAWAIFCLAHGLGDEWGRRSGYSPAILKRTDILNDTLNRARQRFAAVTN
jgi:hypothetical protein